MQGRLRVGRGAAHGSRRQRCLLPLPPHRVPACLPAKRLLAPWPNPRTIVEYMGMAWSSTQPPTQYWLPVIMHCWSQGPTQAGAPSGATLHSVQ